MKRLVLALAVLTTATAAAQRADVVKLVTMISSVTLSSTSVTGGATVNGMMTLNQAAGTGGVTIKFASSNSAIAVVPASVVVQPGATSATFLIQTYPVAVPPNVVTELPYADISAQLGTMTPKTARLTVLPPSFVSFTLDPATVPGTQSATGMVTISGAAPEGGFAIGLVVALPQSSTERMTIDSRFEVPVATVPSQVVIPAGATFATFPITTRAVAATETAQINATRGPFVTKSATLTVLPPSVSSIGVTPCAVSGVSVTGSVTLTGPAPASGMTIPLSVNQIPMGVAQYCPQFWLYDPCGSHPVVPASVYVTAGSTSGTFPITIGPGKGCYRLKAGDKERALSVGFPYPTNDTNPFGGLPASVKGGTAIPVTVEFRGVVHCGFQTHQAGRYDLTSSNPNLAQVPAELVVPAGGSVGTFTITTTAVPSTQTVDITINVFGPCGMSMAYRKKTLTLTP